MTDKDAKEWELTKVTLPELMQKTGGAKDAVEAFAKAQREAWAKSDAEDTLKKQKNEMEKYTKAISQLDVEIARLSKTDEEFREWELTEVTLPRLMKETNGATEKVKEFVAAQRQAWAKDADQKAKEKDKENLDVKVKFYQELAEKSGSYDLTMLSLNESIAKQTELWRQASIPEKYIAQWERLARLEAARDSWSGMERSMLKYVSTATNAADQMEGVFTDAFTSLGNIGGSALEEIFEKGTFSANEFFGNLTRQMAIQAANAASNQLIGGIFSLLGKALSGSIGGMFRQGTFDHRVR